MSDQDPDTAEPRAGRRFRDHFLRTDYDRSTRPSRETMAEASRSDRYLAKRQWEREQGGRFHTWVYVAALVLVIGVIVLIALYA